MTDNPFDDLPEGLDNLILWHNWYYLDDDGESKACECFNDMRRKWIFEGDTMGFNPIYRVGHDMIGRYSVSTVFLGLDHGWGSGPPILWETMIFGNGMFDNWADRASGKRENADVMHRLTVEMVKTATWRQEWDHMKEEGYETWNWYGPPEFLDGCWIFARLLDESFCLWFDRTYYKCCNVLDEIFNESLWPWELANWPKQKRSRDSLERRAVSQKYLKKQLWVHRMSLTCAGVAFTCCLFSFNIMAMLWIIIAVLHMRGERRTDIMGQEIQDDLWDRIDEQQSLLQRSHQSFVDLSVQMKKILRGEFDDDDKN